MRLQPSQSKKLSLCGFTQLADVSQGEEMDGFFKDSGGYCNVEKDLDCKEALEGFF